jgi:hypothetical protein
MTPSEKPSVEARIGYVPPEVVDYGDADVVTKTTNGSTGNDGGSTPPNVYTS